MMDSPTAADVSVPFPPEVLRRVKRLKGNRVCCDCSSFDVDWASVSHGTLLCLNCAGKHRNLGVRVSFVRSIYMDTWSPLQLETMLQGGNRKFLSYLKDNGYNHDNNSINDNDNDNGGRLCSNSRNSRESPSLNIDNNNKNNTIANTSEVEDRHGNTNSTVLSSVNISLNTYNYDSHVGNRSRSNSNPTKLSPSRSDSHITLTTTSNLSASPPHTTKSDLPSITGIGDVEDKSLSLPLALTPTSRGASTSMSCDNISMKNLSNINSGNISGARHDSSFNTPSTATGDIHDYTPYSQYSQYSDSHTPVSTPSRSPYPTPGSMGTPIHSPEKHHHDNHGGDNSGVSKSGTTSTDCTSLLSFLSGVDVGVVYHSDVVVNYRENLRQISLASVNENRTLHAAVDVALELQQQQLQQQQSREHLYSQDSIKDESDGQSILQVDTKDDASVFSHDSRYSYPTNSSVFRFNTDHSHGSYDSYSIASGIGVLAVGGRGNDSVDAEDMQLLGQKDSSSSSSSSGKAPDGHHLNPSISVFTIRNDDNIKSGKQTIHKNNENNDHDDNNDIDIDNINSGINQNRTNHTSMTTDFSSSACNSSSINSGSKNDHRDTGTATHIHDDTPPTTTTTTGGRTTITSTKQIGRSQRNATDVTKSWKVLHTSDDDGPATIERDDTMDMDDSKPNPNPNRNPNLTPLNTEELDETDTGDGILRLDSHDTCHSQHSNHSNHSNQSNQSSDSHESWRSYSTSTGSQYSIQSPSIHSIGSGNKLTPTASMKVYHHTTNSTMVSSSSGGSHSNKSGKEEVFDFGNLDPISKNNNTNHNQDYSSGKNDNGHHSRCNSRNSNSDGAATGIDESVHIHSGLMTNLSIDVHTTPTKSTTTSTATDTNNDNDNDNDSNSSPNSSSPRNFMSRDYRVEFQSTPLGLTLTKDDLGAAEVTKVVTGGQAENEGVTIGDLVVGLDLEWVSGYDALMEIIRGPKLTYPITLVFRSRLNKGASALNRSVTINTTRLQQQQQLKMQRDQEMIRRHLRNNNHSSKSRKSRGNGDRNSSSSSSRRLHRATTIGSGPDSTLTSPQYMYHSSPPLSPQLPSDVSPPTTSQPHTNLPLNQSLSKSLDSTITTINSDYSGSRGSLGMSHPKVYSPKLAQGAVSQHIKRLSRQQKEMD